MDFESLKNKINEKLYVDTDYGKLHLYELYTVLNDTAIRWCSQ